jgi:hypothetical protein
MKLAERLCRMGARSVTIADVCGISNFGARELYKQIHGVPSPSGQTPQSINWYTSSRSKQEESTIFMIAYNTARKSMANGDAFARAYSFIYQWKGGKPLLDPERAYRLTKTDLDFSCISNGEVVKSGSLAVLQCNLCGRQLLAASNHRPFACWICESTNLGDAA